MHAPRSLMRCALPHMAVGGLGNRPSRLGAGRSYCRRSSAGRDDKAVGGAQPRLQRRLKEGDGRWIGGEIGPVGHGRTGRNGPVSPASGGHGRPGWKDAAGNAATMDAAAQVPQMVTASTVATKQVATRQTVCDCDTVAGVERSGCLVRRDDRRCREQYRDDAKHCQPPPKHRPQRTQHVGWRVAQRKKRSSRRYRQWPAYPSPLRLPLT